MSDAAFVHAHVFEPFGMLMFLKGDAVPCGLCGDRDAAIGVFCEGKPLELCQGCYDVRRVTWNVIVVHRDNDGTGKFKWIGPDAKQIGPNFPEVVKQWYNGWIA